MLNNQRPGKHNPFSTQDFVIHDSKSQSSFSNKERGRHTNPNGQEIYQLEPKITIVATELRVKDAPVKVNRTSKQVVIPPKRIK
jgi:hypothetical protein